MNVDHAKKPVHHTQKYINSLLVFIFPFLIALIVYLLTMPHELTWANFGGDGGELITASLTLGVPHPSGYPTYVLLGKLFSFLPIGNVVWRYHLFSATAVSLASAILTQTIFQLNKPQPSCGNNKVRLVSVAMGLAFAFTPLVWEQAIIAEVYGLNLLFVALFLWALLTQRSEILVGFFLGMAITTHLTSLIFLPATLMIISFQAWPKLLLGFIWGLSPFFFIPLFAQGDSPVIWGNPTSLQNWWWVISGTIYHPNQFAWASINFLAKGQQWLSSVGWSLLPLILIGFLQLILRQRKNKSAITPKPTSLIPQSPHLLLALTAVSLTIYAFFYNTTDSIVLILPAFWIFYLLLAPCLMFLEGFALALPLLYLLLNFNTMSLRDNSGIRPYAEQILTTAPPHAILQTNGDPALFSLWYFHYIEEQRPDVAIVDDHLFGFDWYREQLPTIYPDLNVPIEDDLTKLQQENEGKRPYCQVDIVNVNNGFTLINSCFEGTD